MVVPWPSAELEFLIFHAYFDAKVVERDGFLEPDLKAYLRALSSICNTIREFQDLNLPVFHEQPLMALEKFIFLNEEFHAKLGKEFLKIATSIDYMNVEALQLLKTKRPGIQESIDLLAAMWMNHGLNLEQWTENAKSLLMLNKGHLKRRFKNTYKDWANRYSLPLEIIVETGLLDIWSHLFLDALRRYQYSSVLFYSRKTSISLPLPIRFTLKRNLRGNVNDEQDKKIFNLSAEFKGAISQAWNSAKELWKTTHNLWKHIYPEVETMGVSVDLRLAEGIIERISEKLSIDLKNMPFTRLTDTSVGLPCALSLMAQLLDMGINGQILSSGPVHNLVEIKLSDTDKKEQRQLDILFEEEEDSAEIIRKDAPLFWGDKEKNNRLDEYLKALSNMVSAKLDVARNYATYERLILPYDPRLIIENFPTVIRKPGGLQVHLVSVPMLGNAADAYFSRSWRRSHYVRAPELSWLFSGKKGSEMQTMPVFNNQSVGMEFKKYFEQERIFSVHSNRPKIASFAAVHAIRNLCGSFFNEKISLPLPTWTFIRFDNPEFEYGAKFWQVLFDEIGAYAEDIEDFHRQHTWDAKANIIARILNTQSPTWSKRRQFGPAILVIEGIDGYMNYRDKLKDAPSNQFPSSDPYHVTKIFEKLITKVRPLSTWSNYYGEDILKTRIIFTGSSSSTFNNNVPLINLDNFYSDFDYLSEYEMTEPFNENIATFMMRLNEHFCSTLASEILLRASIFRYGFTNSGIYALFWEGHNPDHRFHPRMASRWIIKSNNNSSENGDRPINIYEIKSLLNKLVCETSIIRGGRSGQGLYHFDPTLRESLYNFLNATIVSVLEQEQENARADLHQLHLRAALHFSPFIATSFLGSGFPTILRSDGLKSIYFHEAEYHFRKAREIGRVQESTADGKNRASKEEWLYDFYMRYIEPPGFSTFDKMKRMKNPAIKQLEAELNTWAKNCDYERNSNLPDKSWHPIWLCNIADCFAEEIYRNSNQEGRRKWVDVTENLYDEALQRAINNVYPLDADESEKIASILHIKAHKLIHKLQNSGNDHQLADVFIKELETLLSKGVKISADKLLIIAEKYIEKNNFEKAKYYLQLAVEKPEIIFYQAWIILIGLLVENDLNEDALKILYDFNQKIIYNQDVKHKAFKVLHSDFKNQESKRGLSQWTNIYQKGLQFLAKNIKLS